MIFRKSILAAILSVSVLAAQAQVGDKRTDFAIGLTGGAVANQMSFQPTIKQNMLFGPTFGIAARYISEKYFTCICGLVGEVNFTQLGWNENIEDSNDTYHRTISYIQIPLLMQLGWGREEKGCKFVFEAGPQFGYAIGDKEHFSDPFLKDHRPNNVTQQYGMDIDNRFDYGIAAGLGLEHSSSIGHFILGARYYYGLADVFDNSKKGVFGRSAHGTISLKLTYLFDI